MINRNAWYYYSEAIEFTDFDKLSDDYIGFSPEFIKKQVTELAEFLDDPEVERAVDTNGLRKVVHDFWYTRNGHGIGFWNCDYGEGVGNVLTDIADSFCIVETYEGDDHLLYSIS